MESQSWESSLQSRQPLVGPDVWRGADLPNLSGWRRTLADSEIAELDAALRHTQAHCADWQDITVEKFRLDGFADILAEVRDDLENGRGIVKFSGLPVERYSEDERRRIFFGIGTHLGVPVHQSVGGELMGDI